MPRLLAGRNGAGAAVITEMTPSRSTCGPPKSPCRTLDLDEQTLASAQLHLAIALALTGHPEDAPDHGQPVARLDSDSVNRCLSVLAHHVPADPDLAALIQTLATPADELRDSGSHPGRARKLIGQSATWPGPVLDPPGSQLGRGGMNRTAPSHRQCCV